jgi:magnesium chelatase subunit I
MSGTINVEGRQPPFRILPYSRIVGQQQLKLALELAYIDPEIRGVLISGERGTAKSTAARAFSWMMYGALPTTLPINATEDRVVGGWRIDELMKQKDTWQPGLLEEADGKILYIDEVNLLDDHLVNIILDVASTGVLVVQREGKSKETQVRFSLVGTMNPEEGGLRPQLLDRFGLMVTVPSEPLPAEEDAKQRVEILRTLLSFDREYPALEGTDKLPREDSMLRQILVHAHQLVKEGKVEIPDEAQRYCVRVTQAFGSEGHRAQYMMALAARAYVAREVAEQTFIITRAEPRASKVTVDDVKAVARLAIQHRRPEALRAEQIRWTPEDEARVQYPQPKAAAQAK